MTSLYNRRAVREADAVAAAAIDDLLGAVGKERGVIVASPAGGGKSTLIGAATETVWREGLTAAVCAPTNEQVFSLVGTLGERFERVDRSVEIVWVPARDVHLPAWARRGRIREARPARTAGHARIIVGTFDKLADAFSRGDLDQYDVLLADESYQADAAKYYGVAALASTHMLVGDSGQIDPFSTTPGAMRWRGLPEDPLQTAVGLLRRNHPQTPLHRLPISRRLDPRALTVVRAFYPGHLFAAAVRTGVRELQLTAALCRSPQQRAIDRALTLAAGEGFAHIELPDAAVLQTDPEIVQAIVEIVLALFARHPQVRCEVNRRLRQIEQGDVAVGVAHREQRRAVRRALAAVGFGDVMVETANKLQGLQFEVLVCWHPLAGLTDTDEFHLEAGRLCVLLTRHRHACIVVGRQGDRELLEGIPPAAPGYLGLDDEPLLDGFEAHREVFAALEPVRVALPVRPAP